MALRARSIARSRNASPFELEAGDAQQRENQSQDGREHRDAAFELGNADLVRWRPRLILECDDVTGTATDPAQRLLSRDPELREEVGIARTNDQLADAVVVYTWTELGHPHSRPWGDAHA